MEDEFRDFITFFDKNTPQKANLEEISDKDKNVSDQIEKIDPNISEIIEENGMKLKINREDKVVKSIDFICNCGKKARLNFEYSDE